MQKKMMAAFAALCTMAALMTGCTDVSDGSQTQVDMNAATTAAETTAPAETAETEPAAETAETDTDLSASEEESTADLRHRLPGLLHLSLHQRLFHL